MLDPTSSLIGLIVGAGFGGAVGLLAARSYFRRDPRIEADLRQQVSILESQRLELSKECAVASERENSAKGKAAELISELQKAEQKLSAAQQEAQDLKQTAWNFEAQAKALDKELRTEREQIKVLQDKFHKDFEAVANKLLVDNSAKFSQQSAENLDKLLAPLRENLQEFKGRLQNVQEATAAQSVLLKEQVSRIGTEAANLSKALKGDVKVLGNWGENMLDQILEKSGLQLGVHYRRQASEREAEGATRFLDVVVNLPENKNLVIDSKVSLKAYEEHVNAGDEARRAERLQAHVDSIRAHFKGLGAKRYQDLLGINAPDFVLMYIPVEGAFFAAIGKEPGLFSEALDKNVVLTTNSTLLATLRTVAHVWRLADQRKNALDIADRGGKLYDKFVGFIEDLEGVRKSFGESQASLDKALSKLHTGQGNLISQVEKLKTLGVKASKSLPASLEQDETPALPLRGNAGDLRPGPATSI